MTKEESLPEWVIRSERISDYVLGRLHETELIEFEKQIELDPILAKDVEVERYIICSLMAYFRDKEKKHRNKTKVLKSNKNKWILLDIEQQISCKIHER